MWRSDDGCRFRRCSWAAHRLLASAFAARLAGTGWGRGAGLVDAYGTAVGQAVLAVDHDPLARRDALADDGNAVLRRLDLDRAAFGNVVGLHHIGVGAAGALHDDALGHGDGVLAHPQLQPHVDELARPE